MTETETKTAKRKIIIIICAVVVVVLAAMVGIWSMEKQKIQGYSDNIRQTLTVEAGQEGVDAEDFLVDSTAGMTLSFAENLSAINFSVPKAHSVVLECGGYEFERTVEIVDTTAPTGEARDVTFFLEPAPEPEDFVTNIQDVSDVEVSFKSEPDLTVAGEQSVELLLTDDYGNTAEVSAALTVVLDTRAPEISGVMDRSVYVGAAADYLDGIEVTDDMDETPVLTVDDSQVDLETPGTYTVTYTAADESGNVTELSAVLTVIRDTQAPRISGVRNRTVNAGAAIAYRDGVVVTDDVDEAPVLTVDNSRVNLRLPGTYQVVYTATDASGNKSSVTATVTVNTVYVDPAVIYAEADSVIAQIITDGMTDREKVEAVYSWARSKLRYITTSDKSDWLQAAYAMMKSKLGDCFSYYAVSRLLFERLGLPNISVERASNPDRPTRHYWNMVSVDGGATYYHFDCMPHRAIDVGTWSFCLVTDAYLDSYSQLRPGYYYRDTSLYPATPEA